MYLLDTNIWLERLLGQSKSALVGDLLHKLPADQILLSDFSLHSIGVILRRYNQQAVFTIFVQDVLIDGDVRLAKLLPYALARAVEVMDMYQLDFDDAYQYVIAERENATIVSFDSDFDATPKGKVTPAQLLKTL